MIPTPTPYAYETIEYITLNTADYRVWAFADDAINAWNYYPSVAPVVQTAVVLFLVVLFFLVVYREVRKTGGEES